MFDERRPDSFGQFRRRIGGLPARWRANIMPPPPPCRLMQLSRSVVRRQGLNASLLIIEVETLCRVGRAGIGYLKAHAPEVIRGLVVA